jgi:hypothetical protein
VRSTPANRPRRGWSRNSIRCRRSAFINSQRREGWVSLPGAYDDGGCSGAAMDRPALQRLLADIAAGRVDTVVVYKIDRLTRSLADFAKIVEILEAMRSIRSVKKARWRAASSCRSPRRARRQPILFHAASASAISPRTSRKPSSADASRAG